MPCRLLSGKSYFLPYIASPSTAEPEEEEPGSAGGVYCTASLPEMSHLARGLDSAGAACPRQFVSFWGMEGRVAGREYFFLEKNSKCLRK